MHGQWFVLGLPSARQDDVVCQGMENLASQLQDSTNSLDWEFIRLWSLLTEVGKLFSQVNQDSKKSTEHKVRDDLDLKCPPKCQAFKLGHQSVALWRDGPCWRWALMEVSVTWRKAHPGRDVGFPVLFSLCKQSPEGDTEPLNPTRFGLWRHGQDTGRIFTRMWHERLYPQSWMILLLSGAPWTRPLLFSFHLASRLPQVWPIKLCLQDLEGFLALHAKHFCVSPSNQFQSQARHSWVYHGTSSLTNIFCTIFPIAMIKHPKMGIIF